MITMIDGFISALLLALVLGGSRWMWRTTRTLDRLTDAVAPEHGRGLREIANDHETRLVLLERSNP